MSAVTPQQVVLVAAVVGALVAYVAAVVSIRRRENRAAAAAWYAQQTAARGEGWAATHPDEIAADLADQDAWLDHCQAEDDLATCEAIWALEEDAR